MDNFPTPVYYYLCKYYLPFRWFFALAAITATVLLPLLQAFFLIAVLLVMSIAGYLYAIARSDVFLRKIFFSTIKAIFFLALIAYVKT